MSLSADDVRRIIEEATAKLERNVNNNTDSKIKDLEAALDKKLHKTYAPLKTKVDSLEAKVKDVTDVIAENSEIALRLNNLQLNSLPARDDENLPNIFKALATRLGYEMPPETRIRRFKGADNNNRPIVLTFASELHKLDFLQRFRSNSSNMKRSIFPGFEGDSSRVYLQHDFTTRQYHLYKSAMKLIKENVINKVSVQPGNRIMIQFQEDEKFLNFPDAQSLNAEIERRKNPPTRPKSTSSTNGQLKK